jgi:predicted metal-dependent hydrolase
MPANSSTTLSTARSEAPPDDGEVAGVPLTVRVHPRARRLKLRFDDKRGGLLLTVPPRTSRRAALAWAESQHNWVAAQLTRQPAAQPLEPGAVITLNGEDVRLEWDETGGRSVRSVAGRLVCGGPRAGYERRIEAWLKARARDALSAEIAEIAAVAGVTVRAVSIGDADSRWGSCSASGAIRFSWRLILAPPHVRRFVVAHEVAHRLHMDHSPAFKAAEARLYGGPVAPARLLLRRLSPVLRRVGRN